VLTGISSARDLLAGEPLALDQQKGDSLLVGQARERFVEASHLLRRARLGGGESDAKGSLTIHGQTKDVTFHYTASKSGDTHNVKGSTTVQVGDYGVKPRSYIGVSIKPDVEVFANFQAKDVTR
jgi:hypothetical protein